MNEDERRINECMNESEMVIPWKFCVEFECKF